MLTDLLVAIVRGTGSGIGTKPITQNWTMGWVNNRRALMPRLCSLLFSLAIARTL